MYSCLRQGKHVGGLQDEYVMFIMLFKEKLAQPRISIKSIATFQLKSGVLTFSYVFTKIEKMKTERRPLPTFTLRPEDRRSSRFPASEFPPFELARS